MKQKMENDTTAFLRSFVARRNRNTSAAEDAVLNSKSYTEQEALKLNLINLVAVNDARLARFHRRQNDHPLQRELDDAAYQRRGADR